MPYSCKSLITTQNELASRDKRLSICLGANGFSFAERSTMGELLTFGEVEGGHHVSMTEALTDLKALFASVGVRPLGYASTELVVLSDASAWVPDELYTATANRKYLKLVGSEPASVLTCHSQPLASTAVFTADEQVVTAFKVAVPGIVVMHQHAKLAQLAPASNGRPLLCAHWRQGRVDLAAFRNERYLFGNTLLHQGLDEAVYHIVDVMKSYDLESPATELLLCGEVDRQIFASVRPYFPQVSLFEGSASHAHPQFATLHTYRHALILI